MAFRQVGADLLEAGGRGRVSPSRRGQWHHRRLRKIQITHAAGPLCVAQARECTLENGETRDDESGKLARDEGAHGSPAGMQEEAEDGGADDRQLPICREL